MEVAARLGEKLHMPQHRRSAAAGMARVTISSLLAVSPTATTLASAFVAAPQQPLYFNRAGGSNARRPTSDPLVCLGAFPRDDRRQRQPVPRSSSRPSRPAGSSVDEVQTSKLEPSTLFNHGNVPSSSGGWVNGVDRDLPSQAGKGSEASVATTQGGGEGGRGVSTAVRLFSTRSGRDERDGDLSVVDSEDYASRHSIPESKSLAEVREATSRGQPRAAHMVSGHLQGEMLKLLTRLCRAKRVLDVGTFTGYSAIAFAEALPEDGMVVTLEADAKAAETAITHFRGSPDGHKIELMLGKAMDSIEQLIAQDSGQFDVIFIDADKKR